MGIWFKDVEDYDGAEAALRGGMWGALGYAAWVVVTVGLTFATTDVNFLYELMTPLQKAFFFALTGGRLGIALLAAWRFRIGKGAITGGLTALVVVAVIGFEIANGLFHGIIWYVALLAIELALINGVRAALAIRQMQNPDKVVETFE